MPYNDEAYSADDVTNKLMEAHTELVKRSNLQRAVGFSCDALGMIEKLSGKPVTDQEEALKELGTPGGDYRKSIIGSHLGRAIRRLGRREWQLAGISIWTAIVLMQRLAIDKGQEVNLPIIIKRKAGATCTTQN
jgi:hypothetical protein